MQIGAGTAGERTWGHRRDTFRFLANWYWVSRRMLFRRRDPADWREKLRVAVWPRRSWGRSIKYLAKRVLRLTASPHAIAGGIAAGVFASFTPYMGLHFLIAFAVAYIIAGNMVAAAMGTFFGNPLSFPVYLGGNLFHGKFHSQRQYGRGRTSRNTAYAQGNQLLGRRPFRCF